MTTTLSAAAAPPSLVVPDRDPPTSTDPLADPPLDDPRDKVWDRAIRGLITSVDPLSWLYDEHFTRLSSNSRRNDSRRAT